MWRVDFSGAAERDLGLIFDHLQECYQDFGDPQQEAGERAAARVGDIFNAAIEIGKVPHRGTLRPDIFNGPRFVLRQGTAIWFALDENGRTVHILAMFFGDQDHTRRMPARLLEKR